MTVFELRPEGATSRSGSGPRTAYVLGGGGNLGAIQVGMLKALVERDIFPDALFGCSVGAINAAALAADPTVEGVLALCDIWSGLESDVVCSPGRLSGLLLLTRKYRSLQSNDALRRLLEANIPYRRFDEAAVPVSVVATSLRTGRDQWFSEGQIIPAVLASAALPAVFPPVDIDGESYVDGGVVDNVPISQALAGDFDRVYVLHVGNFARPRPEPKRPLDALLQSFSIARNYRFQTETSCPPRGLSSSCYRASTRVRSKPTISASHACSSSAPTGPRRHSSTLTVARSLAAEQHR